MPMGKNPQISIDLRLFAFEQKIFGEQKIDQSLRQFDATLVQTEYDLKGYDSIGL